MKISNYFTGFTLFFMSLMLSSCSVVEGIFKAGMGVGVFIVIAIIGIIIFLVVRLGRGKKP